MPKFHWDVRQKSREWFALRSGILTASAMTNILTPKTLKLSTSSEYYMYRLLAEWYLGETALNQFESKWMQRGIEEEENAVKDFCFQEEKEAKEIGCITSDDGMFLASPDRMVGANFTETLEIKVPAPWTQIGYFLSSENAADEYRLQCQAQLWVGDLDKSYLYSYCPKLPGQMIEMPRDGAVVARIAVAVDQFNTELLESRLRIEREFGPRPQKPKPEPVAWGLTQEDLDWVLGGMK